MTTCTTCGTRAPGRARFCLNCGSVVTDPAAATLVVPEEEQNVLLGALRRELGREYNVERELGRGGMSVVFLASDLELGRRVALKVLPPELALSRQLSDRFKREAKLAASLDHPNIIPIYGVGQAGGLLYIAMKMIDGRGLDAIVQAQGALPVPVVLHVIRAATRATAFAHDRGIIHRDIKSANILVDTDGRVLVADFGIARAIDDPTMTATGTVVGTPYFMSPEQCAARRIGPQSDQYSLGVVAFQLLTGFVPFHAETLPGIMNHHFYTPVPDVRKSRPDVPPALLEVMHRVLSKKPEHRYATTQAMLADVEAIPFPEADRREGERLLRTLALGAPVDRVHLGPVPALPNPISLTPPRGAIVIDARPRRGFVVAGLVAVAGGALLAAATHTPPPPAEPASSVSIAAPAPPDSTPTPTLAMRLDVPPAASPRQPVPDAPRATRPTEVAPEPAGEAPPPIPAPAAPPGKVRIRVQPATADILLDGRPLGTGVVIDSLVSAGPHRLRIVAPGYQPLDTTIVVASGETTQLTRLALSPVEVTP